MDSKECIWFVSILAAVCLFIAYVIPKSQKVAIEQERIGDTLVNTSAAYTPYEKKNMVVNNIEHFSDTTIRNYVEQSQTRYNPLGDTQTIQSLNLVVPPNDPSGIQTNQKIKNATNTVMFEPGVSNNTGTNVSGSIDTISAAVPGRNSVAEAAKRCEAKAGRNICGTLNDPSFSNECGVCIKGGTRALDVIEGRWSGGLHVSKDDIKNAIVNKVAIQPSAGACPPGFFFVDSKKCEDAVNRLDCEEAGDAGGWLGPKGSIAEQKCAQCAPGETFVYDPKNRSFSFNIRAISPAGSGRTTIKLFLVGSGGSRKEIGAGEIYGSGVGTGSKNEVVVNSKEQVKEGTVIEIEVVQEFSTHTVGQPEVFSVDRGYYGLTKDSAKTLCESLGAQQATLAQLNEAQQAGADWCHSGHLTTGDAKFPIQVKRPGCGDVGVNTWGNAESSRSAVCFGIKPNLTDDYSVTRTSVKPFSEQPTYAESRFGKTNKGIRAILLQLESSLNPSIKIGLEKYLETKPKRFGMFSSSGFISNPTNAKYPNMLKDTYWIWNENIQRNVFRFKMPGTLLAPFFNEDARKSGCVNKMLITKKASIIEDLKTACSGGKPGSYSGECLANLFASAGGDVGKGKLSPKLGGEKAISELLKDGSRNRSEDEITNYCLNLYTIATTGRDLKNNVMSKEVINNASDKMFGFVIASPCEDIEVSNTGVVGLRAKAKPLPVDCLDHLYKNAGSEMSRGFEEDGRRSVIKATYSTIGDRFSGLRKSEFGATIERKALNPFKTCTTEGSLAPIGAKGINTKAIQTINSVSDGSVDGVQTLFDRVFQQANKDGGMITGVGSTLEACFGIFKSPGPSTFDLDYENLMKTLYEPRKVTFKVFNSDAVLNHFNFLLYATRVRDDLIWKRNSSFKIVKALNGRDGYISLESINFPGYYLRHAGFRMYLNQNDNSRIFKDDSSFKIVKGLNGGDKTISLESSNYPDRYIMTDSANNVWINNINKSDKNSLNSSSFVLNCPSATS
jgi:hypothetical protein